MRNKQKEKGTNLAMVEFAFTQLCNPKKLSVDQI